jgi:hypothetical protein
MVEQLGIRRATTTDDAAPARIEISIDRVDIGRDVGIACKAAHDEGTVPGALENDGSECVGGDRALN